MVLHHREGSCDELLVRLPGTQLVYDQTREGHPLKIALLEHSVDRKGKVSQVCEKRDILSQFLWSWVPESRVYGGVSYLGDSNTRLNYDDRTIDFCLRLETIPRRVLNLWIPEDSAYVALRSGMSVDTVVQLVNRGSYFTTRERTHLPQGFNGFFTERVMARLLEESRVVLLAGGSQPHDSMTLEHNVHIEYLGKTQETDCVIAFYQPAMLRKLFRTAEHLTPELHVELSSELERE